MSMSYPRRMYHPRQLDLVLVTSVEEQDDYRRRGYLPDWHRRSPLGYDLCDAGWRAFAGGRWARHAACAQPGTNVIGSESAVSAPVLCDEHFAQVRHLVDEPNIGEDEFRARYGGPDRPV